MGVELGIGESLIVKAIADATGKNKQFVNSEYRQLGDLGMRECGG
jgi:DNA ligase-1